MALKTYIVDGEGSSRVAGVTPNNELKVTVSPYTSIGRTITELTVQKQYNGFLVDSSGSSAMDVNGSVTNQEFALTPPTGRVLYINSIRILLNGTSLEINTNDFRRFGMAAVAPGLTNGLLVYVVQGDVQTNLFVDPIKTIGQFLDYATDFTNLVNSVGTQEDFLSFDFRFDVPIVLVPGSNDKIVIMIRDNLTAIDLFKCVARGYQEVVG